MSIYYGFKWNVATGYRELQRRAAVAALLKEKADAMAAACGPGYASDVEAESGRRRTPRASVRTVTFDAHLDEARNHTLERNIDVAR